MSDEERAELEQPAPDAVTPTEETPKPKAKETAPEETAELLDALFKKVPNVGQARPNELAELVQQLAGQMAEKQVRRLIDEQQQQWEITELAAKLTGGGLRGLPVSIPELTEFFLSLEPVQFDAAKRIFSKITNNGLVEFQEIGHGRRLRKQQLPQVHVPHLREALKNGYSIEDYFETVELGNPADYDLSQFEGGK